MAVVLSNDQSAYFWGEGKEKKKNLNHISLCNICEEYKHRLEKLTQELLSAKKIIQLLQQDVYVAKAITQILTHTSEQNGIKPLSMQWKDSTSDPTLLGSMTEALEEETVHQDNKEEEEEEGGGGRRSRR